MCRSSRHRYTTIPELAFEAPPESSDSSRPTPSRLPAAWLDGSNVSIRDVFRKSGGLMIPAIWPILQRHNLSHSLLSLVSGKDFNEVGGGQRMGDGGWGMDGMVHTI
jgi:hypothetical protein